MTTRKLSLAWVMMTLSAIAFADDVRLTVSISCPQATYLIINQDGSIYYEHWGTSKGLLYISSSNMADE
jgi:hypothetical protein